MLRFPNRRTLLNLLLHNLLLRLHLFPLPPGRTDRVPGTHPDIEGVLVSVVVDHTGYPADFIEMDQDLEGELGIDTVKQAEIVAEIRPLALPVDEDFVLADHPTLNHFTAYIKMQGGGSSPRARPVRQRPTSRRWHTYQGGQSFVTKVWRWQVEIEACPGVPASIQPSGTVVVSDDGWGIAEAFCQRMGLLVASSRSVSALRVAFEMHPVRTRAVEPCFEPTQSNPNIWHGLPTN